MQKEHFLRSIATNRLGFTQGEFTQLINEFGTKEALLEAMKTKAEEGNIALENLEDQVSAIVHQHDGNALAHMNWQPPKVPFQTNSKFILIAQST